MHFVPGYREGLIVMFKNKDCYQMVYIFLTYDISPKYRKCNN